MTLTSVAGRSALVFGLATAFGCSGAHHPDAEPSPQETPATDPAMVVQSGLVAPPLTPALTAPELDRRTAELFSDAFRVNLTIPVPADS